MIITSSSAPRAANSNLQRIRPSSARSRACNAFADRFRAKASLASQAQSKLKQIARMEKIEAPEDEAATVKFRFPQPARGGLKTITLENVDQGYPNVPRCSTRG